MNTITMLGTGSAFPRNFYHSCFLLSDGSDSLLVDGGGGMEVLRRLDRVGMDLCDLHDMFVTHVHTDHIFGAVWVIRRLVQFSLESRYDGPLRVWANAQVTEALRIICRLTLLPAYHERMEQVVEFRTVVPDDEFSVGGMRLRVIDSCSRGCEQSGFIATMPDGQTLAFLGDESLTERNLDTVSGVGHLICGAYCSYADREIFRPYEKHHHTVADVAHRAAMAGVGHLILCHCEDHSPDDRAERYAAEAAEEYAGKVTTPVDGEIICF
ncbi:MAG: MBL fold metallo-hydrolase [Muribaculaceae bacterium]|nr:MBL fold metallo-hydrolase [Muribaculaceae bacterium]